MLDTGIEIIGEYVNMSTRIHVRCKSCGKEWDALPKKMMHGHKCASCAIKNRKCGNVRKSNEEFISQMQHINPNIIITSEYINVKTKVSCKCVICGNEWSATPRNLESGCGCPSCAAKKSRMSQAKTQEKFLEDLALYNEDITILDSYINNNTRVTCMCNKCGNTWLAMPTNLLKKDGTGCPRCRMSHGERRIYKFLSDHAVTFECQKKFDGLTGVGGKPLSYDFFVDDKILVEFQGNFHDNTSRLQTDDGFEKQLEHDKRKRKFAECNKYTLFEIWYNDNIEEKMNELLYILNNPVTTTA